MNKEKMKQIEELSAGLDVVVTIHSRPDGDCVGSGVALLLYFLYYLNRPNVRLFCPDTLPERLAFVASEAGVAPTQNPPDEGEFVISVDTPAEFMLGYGVERIDAVIDHHPKAVVASKVAERGGIVIIDEGAAAAAQVLAGVLPEDPSFRRMVALALFVGIHQDTGGFQFSNATPEVFELAAKLVEVGGLDVAEINTRLNRAPSDMLVALGQTLATLQIVELGNGLRVATAKAPGFAGPVSRELQKLSVDVSVVAYFPNDEGKVRCELRTPNGTVNVGDLARSLGGGGHNRASGFLHEGDQTGAIARLLKAASNLNI